MFNRIITFHRDGGGPQLEATMQEKSLKHPIAQFISKGCHLEI